MKLLRVGALAISLLVLVIPELVRHASERSLYRAVGLSQIISSGGAGSSRGLLLERVDTLVQDASRGLPGDPRPLMTRGIAELAANHIPEAREAFSGSLRLSERADALLGLGFCEAAAGRAGPAREAFLRAGWISPALIPRIPEPERTFVTNEVSRLERLLLMGRLVSIPPPPNAR